MLCAGAADVLARMHKCAYAWSERLLMSKEAAAAAVSTIVRLCDWRRLNCGLPTWLCDWRGPDYYIIIKRGMP